MGALFRDRRHGLSGARRHLVAVDAARRERFRVGAEVYREPHRSSFVSDLDPVRWLRLSVLFSADGGLVEPRVHGRDPGVGLSREPALARASSFVHRPRALRRLHARRGARCPGGEYRVFRLHPRGEDVSRRRASSGDGACRALELGQPEVAYGVPCGLDGVVALLGAYVSRRRRLQHKRRPQAPRDRALLDGKTRLGGGDRSGRGRRSIRRAVVRLAPRLRGDAFLDRRLSRSPSPRSPRVGARSLVERNAASPHDGVVRRHRISGGSRVSHRARRIARTVPARSTKRCRLVRGGERDSSLVLGRRRRSRGAQLSLRCSYSRYRRRYNISSTLPRSNRTASGSLACLPQEPPRRCPSPMPFGWILSIVPVRRCCRI